MGVKRKFVGVGVVLVAVFVCATQSATAATAGHLSGGGTASISQVAFNVSVNGSGGASGSFECLMAGRSASALVAFGLSHIMQVHVTPTAAVISGSTVMFSGPGELIMDGGQHQRLDVVSVWADVATQTFQLEMGSMPPETFVSGGISLR
jgi:hypothetical protein